MSRFDVLSDELRTICRDADERSRDMDQSHPLQRVASLEDIVAGLVRTLSQTLKELAARDLRAKE